MRGALHVVITALRRRGGIFLLAHAVVFAVVTLRTRLIREVVIKFGGEVILWLL